MKNKLLLVLFLVPFICNGQNLDTLKQYVAGPIQTPAYNRMSLVVPPNDDCSNAIQLTVNGTCIIGTTDQGSLQTGEYQPPCATLTFNQSVWYRFTATASRMYVQLELNTVIGGLMSSGRWVSAVYQSTTCTPPASSLISCQTANSVGTADGVIVNTLNGLTVGATYLIQIAYGVGNGITGVPEYCIQVGDQFTPVCNTCQSPCGQACGFSTSPTVNQVVNNCTSFDQLPYNEGTSLVNQCYTFRAVNSTVSFNIIVNSNCGTGNVTNFSYNLYSSSCGTPIQSGTLSNLTFNSLIVGQWYTFCYTFNVPSGCHHTAYWPYFVGAAPLPVDLIEFNGVYYNAGLKLYWSTASEINNDYFDILKSFDGINYFKIKSIRGKGNSNVITNYEYIDYDVCNTIVYYKLKQIDYDGVIKEYDPIAFKCRRTYLYDNFYDILGRKVQQDYDGIKIYQK